MKKGFRAAALLLVAFLICGMLLGVSVGAAEDRDENRELSSEKYGQLMALQTEYFNKGNAGKAANTYIATYAGLINAFDDHDLALTGTRDKILLYYEQGVAAGRLAFIYYSYAEDERIHEGDLEALEVFHTSLQNTVFAAQNATELNALAGASFEDGGLYAQMHVRIFDKMLDALVYSEDSDTIKAFVSEAKEAIKACATVESDTEYRAIYDETARKVAIQRNKETAIEEISELLGVLCPGVEVGSRADALAIIEFINLDTTVQASEINEKLSGFALGLLAEKKTGGRYVDAYVDGLTELVAVIVAEANESFEAVRVTSILANYSFNMKRAELKDGILDDISSRPYASDETLVALESAYNADGGILDTCKSLASLEFEGERAKIRIALYGDLVAAKAKILAFGAYDDLCAEADREYAFYDYNVMSKDPSAEGALDACNAERTALLAELDALVVTAELNAYRERHASVLANENPSVNKADVLAAIEGALSLSEGAAAILRDDGTIDKLAERYKQVAKNEITSILGDEGGEYAPALLEQINGLSVEADRAKLTALIGSANLIVGKAECIDAVLDRLAQIEASDDYPSFSDENKENIKKIADDAASEIVTSAGGDAANAIKDGAITSLNRAEAKAIIDARVDAALGRGDAVDETIKDIAGDAKDKIEDLEDPDEIENAIKDAIFDIEKEIDKKNTEDEADRVKEEIDNKGFLTEEEKKDFADRIDEVAREEIDKIDSATNESERDAALDRFEEAVDKIVGEAESKDSENKKATDDAVKGEIDTKLNSTVEKINGLNFISDADKAALIEDAREISDSAKAEIEKSTSAQKTASIKGEAEKELDAVVSRAYEDDKIIEQTEKGELSTSVKAEYDALISKIDSLTYTSDLLRNELKIKAGGVLDTFYAQNGSAADRGEMETAKAEFLDSASALCIEIDAHELRAAKLWAVGGISEHSDAIRQALVGFKHLDAAAKNELIKQLEAKIASAESHIEIAPDIATVLSIKELSTAAIDYMKEEAARLDDEAFVNQLTPLLISLSVAFILEAAAVAFLLVYKKKAVCAAVALPVMAPALALSPLGAQLIAIGLAVADLALAVYIGYLLSIICLAFRDKRRDKPVVEYEGPEAVEELSLDFESEPKEDPVIDFMHEPLVLDDPVDEITVEEAEELMSDEEAKELEQIEMDFVPEFREEYHGDKRAEINIDTIGACFSAGDKVTLNTLKEKGLVSRRAGYVKILGRGRLDKPLTVVAQKFSASAVKMIALTGGSAIVAEPSPERKRQQNIR